MKQVWYEWKKLISDKSVLLVVVLSMWDWISVEKCR